MREKGCAAAQCWLVCGQPAENKCGVLEKRFVMRRCTASTASTTKARTLQAEASQSAEGLDWLFFVTVRPSSQSSDFACGPQFRLSVGRLAGGFVARLFLGLQLACLATAGQPAGHSARDSQSLAAAAEL